MVYKRTGWVFLSFVKSSSSLDSSTGQRVFFVGRFTGCFMVWLALAYSLSLDVKWGLSGGEPCVT